MEGLRVPPLRISDTNIRTSDTNQRISDTNKRISDNNIRISDTHRVPPLLVVRDGNVAGPG